jgi:beta-lactamase class A
MRIMMRWWLWLLLCTSLVAQEASVESRLADLKAAYSAKPEWKEDLFAPDFLEAVPAAKLRPLIVDLFQKTGAIERFELVEKKNEWSGRWRAITSEGFGMPIVLTLQEEAPHSIIGLFFQPPELLVPDLAALTDRIAKLHGQTSFGIWKLGEKPQALVTHEPDRSLAIGSAFKLYILGALLEEKRGMQEVVPLRPEWRSLPSGRLQTWPVGMPMTLGALTCAMISESDNTATDHLLHTLGRERVEGMLSAMGNAQPQRSLPFLSTSEMFRLKLGSKGELAKGYAKLDVAARREFLAKELAPERMPLDGLAEAAGQWTRPREIDTVEWFASASDLMRALDWLRLRTEGNALARGALAINRGLAISETDFPYVGFKGGSEPGVLCFAHIVQDKHGDWYAVCLVRNDARRSVSEEITAGLATRAFALLAETAGTEAAK